MSFRINTHHLNIIEIRTTVEQKESAKVSALGGDLGVFSFRS